jgi:hypothetical protein
VDHADYRLADVMGRMRLGCSARATSSHEDRAAEQRNQLAPSFVVREEFRSH